MRSFTVSDSRGGHRERVLGVGFICVGGSQLGGDEGAMWGSSKWRGCQRGGGDRSEVESEFYT